MGRKIFIALGLLTLVLLSACGQQQSHSTPPPQVFSNNLSGNKQHTSAGQIVIAQQAATTQKALPQASASSTHSSTSPRPTPTSVPPKATPTTPATSTTPTGITVGNGSGNSPYGSPPAITAAEVTLTNQLFAIINSDRAARGLYPFTWNVTLSSGARQHAWDMVHCGFSHTCPSGLDQCTRIQNEGFHGVSDCGECIGLAGPYPTAWAGVYNVQESMINEPPTGWHRIHLTSTTLHRVGVGLFVDSRGWVWFVEDMVS